MQLERPRAAFAIALALLPLLLVVTADAEPPTAIDFNRDVRPILADHCFQCHGPDANQRKADLRLDTPEATAANREGGPVVVAGDLAKSELWRRIISTDADERMPPPDKGRKLTDGEIAVLRQWILAGARIEKHWSLLPVKTTAPSPIQNSEFRIQNAIDTFVAAKLMQNGLMSAPQADRLTLLRRATLALTGLPPALPEIEAFENDAAPDAYERVVDRLLASPRYGERMAVPWLDAARYADTSGYQSDGERHMWRWRDWVIEALNANMPFDQFTIEQLAGDLLPNATLDQRIATGFNRNHRGNAEGGIIPEEYAIEYVADRVETTSTVWLGLTLGCARCHDHKYDPFTQRDFYSLFAFFNNVPEKGRAIKIGNSPPYIQAPTRLQAEELARLEQKAAPRLKSTELTGAMLAWERQPHAGLSDWQPRDALEAHLPLDGDVREVQKDEKVATDTDLDFAAGRLNQAARFEGRQLIELSKAGAFGFFNKFTLAAWLRIEEGGGGTILSRMVDSPEGEGYQLAIVGGRLQLNLVKRWLDDALRVETTAALESGAWHHVTATYNGSRGAEGVALYIDGQPQSHNVLLDELNQTFATKEPLRIGAGGGADVRFRGLIDEVRVYGRALTGEEAKILATAQTLAEILAVDPGQRNEGQALKAKAAFLAEYAPESIRLANQKVKAAQRELVAFQEQLPTVMVMEEMAAPRETHVLIRGQYDKPGGRVEAEVPGELPPLPADGPRNRLGLAEWIVDRGNPLTGRVFVNRAWQLHFGTGIVKTAEDFGRQGEWPSHPELLDWLAAEFMSDWDVKRLHRTIVTSATFRQSSAVPNSTDPDNRLLSRGPRLRLSAEMVRDRPFAGGMLVEQLGGPSVKPLQPAGLWSELTGGDDYQPGSGSDLVRRSLYTFWKRTIPPPTLSAFDASSREACVVRESRTNTPLQALALLNEPTFVSAAKGLAERVMRERSDPAERIERAMRLVVGRGPTREESKILVGALARYRGREGGDEVAVYTIVCGTILNLDEAVTQQ